VGVVEGQACLVRVGCDRRVCPSRTMAGLRGDPPIVRACREYLRRVCPVHWLRACGVASAFGIDHEDDHYDLAALSYNMGLPLPAMGCSVVYYPPATTATGGGLVVSILAG
jgi:hypothetical protein